MRKIILVAALALAAIPAGALAAKPSHPATPANTNHSSTTANATSTTGKSSTGSVPNVTFVLRGTLTSYTAWSSGTNGSVTIAVKSSNDANAPKGMSLTLAVDSMTKATLHKGKFVPGSKGIVRFRAPKSNTTWTGLTSTRVIEQAPAH
jgi:pectate lyase